MLYDLKSRFLIQMSFKIHIDHVHMDESTSVWYNIILH